MISLSFYWLLLLFLNVFIIGCGSPTEPPQKNVDRNVPPSENFDASYGFWGPDGSTIYFTHSGELGSEPDVGKLDQLWEMNLKTGERRLIHTGRILNADISPDGRWFVFQSFGVPQYLYKMRSDGTELQKLTGSSSPNSDFEYTVVARWSPNEKKILFSVSAGVSRGVALMNKDGSNPRIIIPYGIHASWSSDGSKIIYVNYDTTKALGNQQQIYIANSDGSHPRRITNLKNTQFNISAPDLSPNSQKIVFVHNKELYITKVDSECVEQVTTGPGYVVRPEWNPDGKTILFSRIILNVSKRLYYLNVATREVTPVFPAAKNDNSN